MKKLIKLSAVVLVVMLSSMEMKATPANAMQAKTDTTGDPKKGPYKVDLKKHPEIMAKVRKMIKEGKISMKQNKTGI